MVLFMHDFLAPVHPQWQPFIEKALTFMAPSYLQQLEETRDWLPGPQRLLAAFSLPLNATRYILFGESPYPREQSANGYAFWDNAVSAIWSEKGLSKEVNRATSLRNWIKMLLLARGDLHDDFSQSAIAQLDKSPYVKTAAELFTGWMAKGLLLLNATLVFSEGKVNYHARHWQPFLQSLLSQLHSQHTPIELILLGQIAKKIPEVAFFPGLIAEHPYNISFITNPQVLNYFKPMDLLARHE